MTPEELARTWYDIGEKLIPSFFPEVSSVTRAFDPESTHGRMMTAIAAEVLKALEAERQQTPTKGSPVTHIDPNPFSFRPTQQGWQCPVCGQVMAPFVPYCPCAGKPQKEQPATDTSADPPLTIAWACALLNDELAKAEAEAEREERKDKP